MRWIAALKEKITGGFTVLEVIVAIFIFSCVSAAILNLIGHADRIHGRAVFVSGAVRLAAGEAERLRSYAAKNVLFEDSIYSETLSGRRYQIHRNVLESESPPSFQPTAREPVKVELIVSDENNSSITPLRFMLLLGQDNP